MFEPVHGSASDIAGQGIGNPFATIWSASRMLDHFGYEGYGKLVINAIEQLLVEGGTLTPDMKGRASTSEVGNRVIELIATSQIVKI